MARLDRLDDASKRALQIASVIGREFALRLLERIHETGASLGPVVEELRALELIYEKARHPELAYMFKHALTHDVAYESVLASRRRALHRGVADAIEEVYRDRLAEHYETLARHYTEAGVFERALFYHERSSEKAAAAFANQAAAEHCRAALALAGQLRTRRRRRAPAGARGAARGRALLPERVPRLGRCVRARRRARRHAGRARRRSLARGAQPHLGPRLRPGRSADRESGRARPGAGGAAHGGVCAAGARLRSVDLRRVRRGGALVGRSAGARHRRPGGAGGGEPARRRVGGVARRLASRADQGGARDGDRAGASPADAAGDGGLVPRQGALRARRLPWRARLAARGARRVRAHR